MKNVLAKVGVFLLIMIIVGLSIYTGSLAKRLCLTESENTKLREEIGLGKENIVFFDNMTVEFVWGWIKSFTERKKKHVGLSVYVCSFDTKTPLDGENKNEKKYNFFFFNNSFDDK